MENLISKTRFSGSILTRGREPSSPAFTMKRAIVTGANGFVGSHVCKELIQHGYKVRGLARDTSDTSEVDNLDIEIVRGDIRDSESLLSAFEDIDVVFHIAALFREAKHPDSVYRDINVTGTTNVLDAAIESGIKKVIHCSTVGVHSHIPNPPATEDEEYRPGDIYQETKCEGEQIALKYFRDRKIDGVVIRPAMIWGEGDSRTLKLFRGIANRKFPLIGTGRTLVHWVHVKDLARAFRLAAEGDTESGDIFIISGERPVEMQYLYQRVAGEFGVAPPKFKIPAFPVQLIGTITECLCIPFGIEPPIYRRRVDFFTKTRAFCSDKAKEKLGYQPENSFEDEVAQIAKGYQNLGLI